MTTTELWLCFVALNSIDKLLITQHIWSLKRSLQSVSFKNVFTVNLLYFVMLKGKTSTGQNRDVKQGTTEFTIQTLYHRIL